MALGTFTVAHSQVFSHQMWHDGYVVSTKGDTLSGSVKYDLEANVVQVRPPGRGMVVYTSHQVFYAEIFDSQKGNYRQFYSLPHYVNYDYKIPILFEVLYEGSLSLLAREQVVEETVSNSSPYSIGTNITRQQLVYTYYFLDKSGNMKEYDGRRSTLLSIMAKHQSRIKNFIKSNHLNVKDFGDLARIAAFYNAL